jgi:hypothetical protein
MGEHTGLVVPQGKVRAEGLSLPYTQPTVQELGFPHASTRVLIPVPRKGPGELEKGPPPPL